MKFLSVILLSGCALCPLAAQSLDTDPSPSHSSSINANPTGLLDLSIAFDLAEQQNPDLAVFTASIRTREALRLQAGLRPNPSLQLEVEDFGKSRGGGSFNDAETTLSVGQLILLGDKRRKNVHVRQGETDLATWDFLSARRRVLTFTAQAFTEVLAAQEQLKLSRDALNLASNLVATVSAQVDAGKVSAIEKLRASVIHARQQAAFNAAVKDLEIRRVRLASAWGSRVAVFERVNGSLDELTAPHSGGALDPFLSEHPDVARWRDEQELRRSRLELQKARRIPDVTVRGGVRRFEASDSAGFTLSLSLPLPFINRNQGNIMAAKSELAASTHAEAAARTRVAGSLATAYKSLEAAFQNAVAHRDEIVPASTEAFELSEEAYRQGKLGLIDLLDTQRVLFEARRAYVDALAGYHRARIEVEGLIGRPLNSIVHQSKTSIERKKNEK